MSRRLQFSLKTLLVALVALAMFFVAFHADDICPHRGKISGSSEEFYFFWLGRPRDNCPGIYVESRSSKKFLTRWPIRVGREDLAWAAADEE